MDQDEAAEIVELHLNSHPKEQVLDDLVVPALNYVKRDFALDKMPEKRAAICSASHPANSSGSSRLETGKCLAPLIIRGSGKRRWRGR